MAVAASGFHVGLARGVMVWRSGSCDALEATGFHSFIHALLLRIPALGVVTVERTADNFTDLFRFLFRAASERDMALGCSVLAAAVICSH